MDKEKDSVIDPVENGIHQSDNQDAKGTGYAFIYQK